MSVTNPEKNIEGENARRGDDVLETVVWHEVCHLEVPIAPPGVRFGCYFTGSSPTLTAKAYVVNEKHGRHATTDDSNTINVLK